MLFYDIRSVCVNGTCEYLLKSIIIYFLSFVNNTIKLLKKKFISF